MSSCYTAHQVNVDGATYKYFAEGAYGVIFVDDKKRKIVKIYKRSTDKKEEHVMNAFKAEAEAYKKANDSCMLSKLIPGGFRSLVGCTISNRDGSEVTEQYFEDCAFKVDFVPGNFIKIGRIDSNVARQVCQLFHQEGIRHTKDMSVTLDNQNRVIKAIDFATVEYELNWCTPTIFP